MSQQAALETFSIERRAIDARADGATRTVRVSRQMVNIDRSIDGIRMRLAIPVAAYRDLVILVRMPLGTAQLVLRHGDPDLDVIIGVGEATAVAKSARAWSTITGKAVSVEEACIAVHAAFPRKRKRVKPSRRSSFARNRRVGSDPAARPIFREREIIART